MKNFRRIALIGAVYNNFPRLLEILSLINLRDRREVDAIIAYGGIDAKAYGSQLNVLSDYINDTLNIPFYLIPTGIDNIERLSNWFGVGKLRFMPQSPTYIQEMNFNGVREEVTVYKPALNVDGFKIGCSYTPLGKRDTVYGADKDNPDKLHLFVGYADQYADVGNVPLVVSPSLTHESTYQRIRETDRLEIVRLKKTAPEFYYYGCSLEHELPHLWRVYISLHYDGWSNDKIERLDARPQFNVTKAVYHNIHIPAINSEEQA